ncbi:hypothetical protein [Mycolicibacterium mengxianglii]|uniref:hypothetical protein n=1 Tax=Mycolicibacterium mengxianglii TaxID=2736649 RepID=UPI0027D9EA85|nr:hypothetical protein [Mycolicibacterium mengxianglii]
MATVGVVVVLFVTAGSVVQVQRFLDIHGYAAIALHVFSGALSLSLLALASQRKHGWWAAGLAVVLFAYSFVQAYLGKTASLYMHIPGSLMVAAASISLAVWLLAQRVDGRNGSPVR